jgi:hypothetical protein
MKRVAEGATLKGGGKWKGERRGERAIPGLGFPNRSDEIWGGEKKKAQVVEKEGGECWKKLRKIGTRLA